MKKESRFIVIHKEGSQLSDRGTMQVMVDKDTGVTYLMWKAGYGASITPLLDPEGKPIITRL